MSQSIAFIGVGNMGCPMAENLMKAGKSIKVFDVSKKMLDIARDKKLEIVSNLDDLITACLLYTSPSPRDLSTSRMPSSA